MIDKHHGWNVSFKPLVLGFIFSALIIFGLFRIATKAHVSEFTMEFTLISLAILQTVIQMVFFFHLGLGEKPRWHLMMFLFTIFVVVIVIGGSMWIMYNLRYNVMLPVGG